MGRGSEENRRQIDHTDPKILKVGQCIDDSLQITAKSRFQTGIAAPVPHTRRIIAGLPLRSDQQKPDNKPHLAPNQVRPRQATPPCGI